MRTNVTVILAAHLPWWDELQTPHYVANLLARHVNIVYVEPRVAWSRQNAAFHWKQNLSFLRTPLRRINENLWVYTPWALPLGRFKKINSWNDRSLRTGLRRVIARLPSAHLVLWLADTRNSPNLVQAFPDAPRIFHALDYFVDDQDARAASELAQEADLVLAASPLIAESLKNANARVSVFRNGWQFPSKALENPSIPEEVARVPRPRVGLVGYLSSNLDYSLLHRLVESLPMSLILLGRTIGKLTREERKLLGRLRENPRVFFLGERPTEQIPGYLQAFDVCIAPYKNMKRIHASDPLKVYQYLALGKPVVATSVDVLEGLQPLVWVAQTEGQFSDFLRREIRRGNHEDLRRQRIEFAMRATWENRWSGLRKVLACNERLCALAKVESFESGPLPVCQE